MLVPQGETGELRESNADACPGDLARKIGGVRLLHDRSTITSLGRDGGRENKRIPCLPMNSRYPGNKYLQPPGEIVKLASVYLNSTHEHRIIRRDI